MLTKPKYEIGQKFVNLSGQSKIWIVTDVHRTYNAAEELIGVRYMACPVDNKLIEEEFPSVIVQSGVDAMMEVIKENIYQHECPICGGLHVDYKKFMACETCRKPKYEG